MTRIGQYEILAKIAAGGMGIVYRAVHVALHREVALKVLQPELVNDISALARFQREAQSASKLRHPNIIEVYDLGVADGQHYIAMEYLPDGSLQQKLRENAIEGKVFSEEEVLRLIRPVADALNYAHEQGLIHRDIKPSNILLRANGTPVLADFGIVLATAATRLTRNLSTIGTPEYMSPEQGKGGALDGRSDLYSLGIVMYEMLAGLPPFQADTPVAVVYKHIKERLPDLPRNDISQRTRRIIEKVTAKDPNDRYQTGAEMARAIDQALEELSRTSGSRKPFNAAAAMPGALAANANKPRRPISHRNAIMAIVGVAALILLVGGGAIVLAALRGYSDMQQGSGGQATVSVTPAARVTPTDSTSLNTVGATASAAATMVTVTPDMSSTDTPAPESTSTVLVPTDTATPLPSGSCLPGFVWRLARPTDKVCAPPVSHSQAISDNLLAASRRVVASSGPDTCKHGYVWRNAFSNDHVCVTPAVQAQAQADNAAAASRKLLLYGPDTCKQGFVWRNAYDGDHVCVTADVRSQAQADNAAAASRVDSGGAYGPNSCISGYVWRVARSDDLVCVLPSVRSQTADDNAAAASRVVVASSGPDTCQEGYVWRTASPTDHVCVTADVRAQAQADNAAANSRKLLEYGPDTCIDGYVWRAAYTGDHVCVTPDVYAQVQKDNTLAASRTVP
ncbi:MAG: protein kinase [Chloroflexi bacterium]|nr:protein kinase [Chloroflexota bacterium]MCL5275588.1 protein kinase [Chloroflexota bacterium]